MYVEIKTLIIITQKIEFDCKNPMSCYMTYSLSHNISIVEINLTYLWISNSNVD